MDSDRLNRWLTLVANVGVLTGIVLILIELDQNADLMRAQITQARSDNVLDAYRAQMHSDSWAQIEAKRIAADSVGEWIDSLTPAEYAQTYRYQLHEYHDIRIQFVQYNAGLLDEQIWAYSTKGQTKRFMQRRPHFYFGPLETDPEFLEYLNNVAREYGLPIAELATPNSD